MTLQPQNRPSDNKDGNYDPRGKGSRRRLDVDAIKSFIIFVTGACTALIGGLTGLGAQLMFAPMLTWMLGYAEDKAQGTAMSFAAWTALAATAGVYMAGALPVQFLLYGLLLTFGAVVGATLTAGVAKKMQSAHWRRTSQGIGMMLTLAVIVQAAHSSGMFVSKPNIMEWHSPLSLFMISVVVGACTQILGLTSGTLLVPALYFFTGLKTHDGNHATPAVALSIMVIALASVLPAVAYTRRGLVDTVHRFPILAAGSVGGFCAGMLAGRLMERAVIISSAVIAMFLCARELSRLASTPNERVN